MVIIENMLYFHLPLADLIYSFKESNTPGQAIVVLLFMGSIYAWTIMVTKGLELRQARLTTARFLMSFRKEPNPVTLFLRRQKFPESPSFRVYEKGCAALATELETQGGGPDELFVANVDSANERLTSQQFEVIRNVTERHVADQALLLERQMGVLAIAVSASPFLGLLGTVWGVMEAFTGMAQAGTATLSAVAPGIAAALLTTVVGLLVALPSAVGYNLLAQSIRELHVEMDNFSQEWLAQVQTVFMRHM
jgi:biopolymer transport protein TolQ